MVGLVTFPASSLMSNAMLVTASACSFEVQCRPAATMYASPIVSTYRCLGVGGGGGEVITCLQLKTRHTIHTPYNSSFSIRSPTYLVHIVFLHKVVEACVEPIKHPDHCHGRAPVTHVSEALDIAKENRYTRVLGGTCISTALQLLSYGGWQHGMEKSISTIFLFLHLGFLDFKVTLRFF